jgi:murein DD-endopeptidase MepM/ murein hydrolase activator NlpD
MRRRPDPHGDRTWLVGLAAVALLTAGVAARASAEQVGQARRHPNPTTTVACDPGTTTTSSTTSTSTSTTASPAVTDTTVAPPCQDDTTTTSLGRDSTAPTTTASSAGTTLAADSSLPQAAPETTTTATPIASGETTPTTVAPPTTEPDVAAPELPPTPPQDWPVRAVTFPVAGPVTYYGACRGGPTCPRRHIGNDLIGQRLQPLIAAADGVVTHLVRDHPTAGWGLVIKDADGWEYRYYHVNNDSPGTDDGSDPAQWRLAPGITEGTAVKAGQVVAYLGDSGNSELSVPHLHFEIHLPDGSPIDPYRSLRASELATRCSAAVLRLQVSSVLMPPVTAAMADAVVHTTTGRGRFLLSLDGTVLALGDARSVGWSRHAAEDPPCPPPAASAPTPAA